MKLYKVEGLAYLISRFIILKIKEVLISTGRIVKLKLLTIRLSL
jgi:hypothetical protein